MKNQNLHNLHAWIVRNKSQFPLKLKTLEEGYYFTFFLNTWDNVVYQRSVSLTAPWPLVAQELNSALAEIKKISVMTYGNSCWIAA